jgi:hypothetical protein
MQIQVCVIVDKLEKLPRDKVEEELATLGVNPGAIDGMQHQCWVTVISRKQHQCPRFAQPQMQLHFGW